MLDQLKLEEHYRQWESNINSVLPTNRTHSQVAIDGIALLDNQKPPSVVCCQNLFELALLPSVLFSCLSSREWKQIFEKIGTSDFKQKKAQDAWSHYWSDFYAEVLVPLLRDMVRPMPQSDLCASYVPGLISSLKHCLEMHLQSADHNLMIMQERISAGTWSYEMQRSGSATAQMNMLRATLLDMYRRKLGNDPQCLGDDINSHVPGRLWRIAAGRRDFMVAVSQWLGINVSSQLISAIWLPMDLLWLAELLEYDQASDRSIFFGSKESESGTETKLVNHLLDLSVSCSALTALESIYFVCDNPIRIETNEDGVLHKTNDAALVYGGGFELFAWNGILVPESVIKNPEQIDLDAINNERNVAVRRVMIERYGMGKYLLDVGANIIHQDDYGVLYRSDSWGREPLVMVKVINSTAEPDGTFREYFLRVPPNMQSAQQAVAWTFSMDEQEYKPDVES